MSTRSNVVIKSGETKIYLYRHSDGYLAEAGYNLACSLMHSNGFKSFLNSLLSQKYEADTIREARAVYEFTTEQHGDIEYLYQFEFDVNIPGNVKVVVESVASWDIKKTLINTKFALSHQNIREHLKPIFDEHNKVLLSSFSIAS